MGLGRCYTGVKYLMFIFNFIFWLLGCAILGVGIWIRADPELERYVAGSNAFESLYIGAYVLIGVGVIIMVIGFVGCCGAIRESPCLLIIFFIFLFLIFAVLLAFGIWAILYKHKLKEKVAEELRKAVNTYKTEAASKELMDGLQIKFHCCGSTEGQSEYQIHDEYKDYPPPTCYDSSKQVYTANCTYALVTFFGEHQNVVAGCGIGIGVIMILGMIFSLILCCAVNRYKRRDTYRYYQ